MSSIAAGTTTTTALVSTADTTGSLVFQTGASATTAMTINTSQNVGIGTSSPAQKLSVAGTVESTSGGFKFPDGTTQTTAASAAFTSGTLMLFQQTAAPTGWTKQITHDNKALRVVSGTATSGGSVAFTTAFASQAVSGTVGNTTLVLSQIPSHNHSGPRYGSGNSAVNGNGGGVLQNTIGVASNGSDGAHNHGFTGTAINLAVQYVDLIIASKD